ncbi:MAG TPA: wax ester/triacylglycerol synthase family O-acyltransferase [Kribbella sp.]|nr:wax ester/triacylglycerol synthase family O-acyltransferase [Kribbella sp.]
MAVVGPLDALFLFSESLAQPVHVGGLLLFELPADAGPDYVGGLYRDMLREQPIHPLFGRRISNRPTDLGYWSWVPDDAVELEHHVQLSVLARPGRIRDLLEVTSAIQGRRLDPHRPLWELHLIDGVEGGRFAIYIKVHHAMMDGVTALRWMEATLATDPSRTDMPGPYALPEQLAPRVPSLAASARAARDEGSRTQASSGSSASPHDSPGPTASTSHGLWPINLLTAAGRTGAEVSRVVGDLAGQSPLALRSGVNAVRGDQHAMAFRAPRTILNGPVTTARRFAAQSWPMQRLDAVRASTGATINDVMLAMCAGALRNYLVEQDALPGKALTAMVPVSLRTALDAGAGNSLATLLCDLATDERDPVVRLQRVRDSMARGKALLSRLSPVQNLMLGALGLGAAGIVGVLPGVPGRTPPPYNLVISNVPGPVNTSLYWNRSKLLALYPASVVVNGQALNITVTSYDRGLHFGLMGCPDNVPHLQRLLIHLEASLVELESL